MHEYTAPDQAINGRGVVIVVLCTYMYIQLEQNPSGSSSRAVCLEVTICATVVDQNFLVGKNLGTKLYVVISLTYFCYPPLPAFVPSLQNDISEEEQRWGSKTVEGSAGRAGALR